MTILSSVILMVLFVLATLTVLRKQGAGDETKTNRGLFAEYRTDYAVDECIDLLREAKPEDMFRYTLSREADGSFLLNFKEHIATGQGMDTLYALRFDAGKQTVVTATFLREVFGYKEPVFPISMLDDFFAQKLSTTRSA